MKSVKGRTQKWIRTSLPAVLFRDERVQIALPGRTA